MINRLLKFFENPVLRHVLFWVIVYLYFILSVSNNGLFANQRHILEIYGKIVLAQMIVAYTCIYLLIPRFLDRKKTGYFVLWLFILLVSVFAAYQAVRMFYFDIVYFDSYNDVQRAYAIEPYWKRLTNLSVLLSKFILFLAPAALLLMARFYKNQQKFLKLNEQKKIAELTALRNQLNPHFLFNTLNNLYALALDKSEKAPEVIERLSDILDYILYRCKAKYVPAQKEAELIENYIALEKVRYGDRVTVNFEHRVGPEVKIAPLLLLTFVENAFKHGVSQELKQARLHIFLTTFDSQILFSLQNTKPKGSLQPDPEHEAPLGLKNVRQQLELLYAKAYDLRISDTEDCYKVVLKLKQR